MNTVVLMRWGLGTLSLRVPCRVLEVLEEPGRRSFPNGTLRGHPEAGEERFLLEHLDEGPHEGPLGVAVQRSAEGDGKAPATSIAGA